MIARIERPDLPWLAGAVLAGGVAALKGFHGPFPEARFCPTGGVTLQTAPGYLELPNVLCVGGSWLTPADAHHPSQYVFTSLRIHVDGESLRSSTCAS